MNIEKMTTTLQEAIAEAQQIAVTRKHQDIDIAHVWKIFLQPNHFNGSRYFSVDEIKKLSVNCLFE